MARKPKGADAAADAAADAVISDDDMLKDFEGDEPGSARDPEDSGDPEPDDDDDDGEPGGSDPEPEVVADAKPVEAGAAEQVTEPVASAPTQDFIAAARERYNLNLGDSQDVALENLGQLLQAAGQVQQMRQLAQIGQQAMPKWNEFQAWQQQQAQAAQKPAEEELLEPWKPVEYDEAWENLVDWQKDEQTGQVIPVPRQYADPSIAPKLMAHRTATRNNVQKLANAPIKTLRDGGLDKVIKQIAQEVFKEGMGSERQQDFVNATVQSRLPLIAEKDSQGQVRFDPLTGQPVLNRFGHTYTNMLARLAQGNPADPRFQDEVALEFAQMAERLAPTTVTTQTGATTTAGVKQSPKDKQAAGNKQYLDKHRDAAAHQPSKSGASPGPQGVKKVNLEKMMRERFEKTGLLNGHHE